MHPNIGTQYCGLSGVSAQSQLFPVLHMSSALPDSVSRESHPTADPASYPVLASAIPCRDLHGFLDAAL